MNRQRDPETLTLTGGYRNWECQTCHKLVKCRINRDTAVTIHHRITTGTPACEIFAELNCPNRHKKPLTK